VFYSRNPFLNKKIYFLPPFSKSNNENCHLVLPFFQRKKKENWHLFPSLAHLSVPSQILDKVAEDEMEQYFEGRRSSAAKNN